MEVLILLFGVYNNKQPLRYGVKVRYNIENVSMIILKMIKIKIDIINLFGKHNCYKTLYP